MSLRHRSLRSHATRGASAAAKVNPGFGVLDLSAIHLSEILSALVALQQQGALRSEILPSRVESAWH